MNFDFTECKTLSEETLKIFFGHRGLMYNPFQVLCNWLYGTKFDYGDRKRDSYWMENMVVLTEEHIDQIIEAKLFEAVDPEKYDEDSLKNMLREFIGLKVFAK